MKATVWLAVATAGLALLSIAFLTIQSPLTTTVTVTVQSVTGVQSIRSVEDVCFSRVSQCDAVIAGLIKTAKTRILVAVYSFTSDVLADALVEAAGRGVEVKVVVEAEQAGVRGSEYERLRKAGVDIKLDGNQYLMHHKFMVVDSLFVVTGSYNWSRAAEDFNDENIVVLEGVKVAEMFEQEFHRLWSMAG
ncbi:MAG: phospholipase D-like domain-containing protein [Candidatus Caldarchaeum sp.]